MPRIPASLFALTLALFTTASISATRPTDVVIGHKFSLDSAVMKEKRDYWVYLPTAYNDKLYGPVRYPVMYILDGDAHFHSASGVVNFMSEANHQIPGMIVVAIPNTNRMRDLTPTHSNTDIRGKESKMMEPSGGGDRFLQFISKELMPRIEADYRTAPFRVFVGHSLGGLTVLHSLLSQPGLYQGYIAIDSSLWWQDQFMVKRLEDSPIAAPARSTRVFMSLADHRTIGEHDSSAMILGNMRFAELLQRQKSSNLQVKLQHFSGEDHGSVPLPTLYYGLLHVFEGYKTGDQYFYKDDVEDLKEHFRAVSERLGYPALPPEQEVDQLAHAIYGFFQKSDLALAYLQLNIANYPTSSHARSSLGNLYGQMGDNRKARALYEEALRLNSDNREARDALKALGGK